MEKIKKNRYLRAQKSSFKTRLDLYLFQTALQEKNHLKASEFLDFAITQELVHLYSTGYWQKDHEDTIGEKGITIKDLYESMEALKTAHVNEFDLWQKTYAQQFVKIFPEDKFEELLLKRHCEYCKITEAEIAQLGEQGKLFKKSERGWSLEIDRKNSNFEYTPENCVMACYWCNNAKTDEFTYEEFAKVGAAIKDIWQSRQSTNP